MNLKGLHKKWGYQQKALFQGFLKMPLNLLQLKRKAEKIDDKGKSVPSDSMQKMAIRSIFGLLNVSFLIPTYLYLCLLDILLFDNGVGKKRTAKWLKINSWLTWNSFLKLTQAGGGLNFKEKSLARKDRISFLNFDSLWFDVFENVL